MSRQLEDVAVALRKFADELCHPTNKEESDSKQAQSPQQEEEVPHTNFPSCLDEKLGALIIFKHFALKHSKTLQQIQLDESAPNQENNSDIDMENSTVEDKDETEKSGKINLEKDEAEKSDVVMSDTEQGGNLESSGPDGIPSMTCEAADDNILPKVE